MKIRAISVRSSTDDFAINSLLPALQGYYNSIKEPDTEVDFVFPRKGARLMDQQYWESLYTSYIMELINEVDENVYDGVLILCLLDACLIAAKERLNIPVVGLLQSSLALAYNLGRRVTILQPKATSSNVRGAIGPGGGSHDVQDKARLYGMDNILVSVRCMQATGLEVDNSNEEQRNEILLAAKQAVEEDGTDVLILGCGAMFGMVDFLKDKLGIPVIDPNVAALKTIEILIKMRLSQSKSAYPRPNLEAME